MTKMCQVAVPDLAFSFMTQLFCVSQNKADSCYGDEGRLTATCRDTTSIYHSFKHCLSSDKLVSKISGFADFAF